MTSKIWPLVGAAALLAGMSLSAASVPRMSFERVVRSSPRVVRGVVTRSWSAWDANRRTIWTHYDLRVSETLRGPAGPSFVISEPGGTVDGLTMEVPGAPRFSIGEEAVVFAYPTPLGYWRVRGWGQGRFRIEQRNGQSIVRAPDTGALLLDLRTPNAKAAATAAGPQDLEAFLEHARALIGREAGQ